MSQIGIIKIKKLVDGLLTFVREDYLSKITLQGTLVHTTANAVGVKKKDTITLVGTSGGVIITDVTGADILLTYSTSLTQTCLNFVAAMSALFLTQGIVLTASGANIIFEAFVAGVDFVSPTVRDLSEESFLMRCFDDEDEMDGILYKDLAIEIFTRTDEEQRRIETRLMFDLDRAPLPTIHVREPAKGKGKTDAIGYMSEDIYENTDGSYEEERRRSFTSQYELMATSMNRHEVIIIEEVMTALLIGSQDTLALANPFYVFDFSVKELIANNELVPNPLFIKSIGLHVSYNKTYPDLSSNQMLGRILFTQNILT